MNDNKSAWEQLKTEKYNDFSCKCARIGSGKNDGERYGLISEWDKFCMMRQSKVEFEYRYGIKLQTCPNLLIILPKMFYHLGLAAAILVSFPITREVLLWRSVCTQGHWRLQKLVLQFLHTSQPFSMVKLSRYGIKLQDLPIEDNSGSHTVDLQWLEWMHWVSR